MRVIAPSSVDVVSGTYYRLGNPVLHVVSLPNADTLNVVILMIVHTVMLGRLGGTVCKLWGRYVQYTNGKD